MTRVYVVVHDKGYDGASVEGVFSTRSKALGWRDAPEQAWYREHGNELRVEVWVLDKPARYG